MKKGDYVKWRYGRDIRYGIYRGPGRLGVCRPYGTASDYSYVRVEDAIVRDIHIVHVSLILPISEEDYKIWLAERLKLEQRFSRRTNNLTGKIFSVPTTDGESWYAITKEFDRMVKVEWRGFSLSRRGSKHFGMGCLISKDEAEELVKKEEMKGTLFDDSMVHG